MREAGYYSNALRWRARTPPSPSPVPESSRGPRTAYLMNVFPALTETFVTRELQRVRGLGLDVTTFSIRPSDDADARGGLEDLRASTFYILPIPVWELLHEHFCVLLRQPLNYLSTLTDVWVGEHDSFRDRLRSLGHFIEGVVLVRHLRERGIEHIHAHFAVGSATVAWVASRLMQMRFSVTAHAYDIWRDRLLLREKMREARFVVTCTQFNLDHLARTYPESAKHLRLVYHGVDAAYFSPGPPRVADRPRVLSVGRLVPQKGMATLVRAAALLKSRHVDFDCVVVGEGPLEEKLRSLAASLDVADRFRFVGRVEHSGIREYYRDADVFALACTVGEDNDRDGIPNTMLEAMACGLPVVSTRVSGVPELVTDEHDGFLVNPDDVQAFAVALERYLASPARRQAAGERARETVVTRFAQDLSAKKLVDLFEELAARRD